MSGEVVGTGRCESAGCDVLIVGNRSAWANSNQALDFPVLKEYLTKYQDPKAADSIMKIQKELDETKIVLHKTIESVLERGMLLGERGEASSVAAS